MLYVYNIVQGKYHIFDMKLSNLNNFCPVDEIDSDEVIKSMARSLLKTIYDYNLSLIINPQIDASPALSKKFELKDELKQYDTLIINTEKSQSTADTMKGREEIHTEEEHKIQCNSSDQRSKTMPAHLNLQRAKSPIGIIKADESYFYHKIDDQIKKHLEEITLSSGDRGAQKSDQFINTIEKEIEIIEAENLVNEENFPLDIPSSVTFAHKLDEICKEFKSSVDKLHTVIEYQEEKSVSPQTSGNDLNKRIRKISQEFEIRHLELNERITNLSREFQSSLGHRTEPLRESLPKISTSQNTGNSNGFSKSYLETSLFNDPIKDSFERQINCDAPVEIIMPPSERFDTFIEAKNSQIENLSIESKNQKAASYSIELIKETVDDPFIDNNVSKASEVLSNEYYFSEAKTASPFNAQSNSSLLSSIKHSVVKTSENSINNQSYNDFLVQEENEHALNPKIRENGSWEAKVIAGQQQISHVIEDNQMILTDLGNHSNTNSSSEAISSWSNPSLEKALFLPKQQESTTGVIGFEIEHFNAEPVTFNFSDEHKIQNVILNDVAQGGISENVPDDYTSTDQDDSILNSKSRRSRIAGIC